MITLSLNIRQSEKEIANLIGQEIAKRCNAAVFRPLDRLKAEVATIVEQLIDKSPESDSLRQGILRHELGLVNPEENIKQVITAVINAAQTIPYGFSYNGRLSGGFQVAVLRDDLSDALGATGASFTSPEGGFEVDWLEWLLTGGTDLVIDDYAILYGPVSDTFSRTDSGIMIKSKRGYRIFPDAFTGTKKDNWLTRALNKLPSLLNPIVQAEFARAFR